MFEYEGICDINVWQIFFVFVADCHIRWCLAEKTGCLYIKS